MVVNKDSVCSAYTSFHSEVVNLREILKKNSNPSGIIEQSIRSFLNKLHVPKKVIPTVPKKELFIVICKSTFYSTSISVILK